MPKITVRRNIRKEKERFNKFLFNQRYLSIWSHVRDGIFGLYPELEERLSSSYDLERKEVVDSFVQEQYDSHKSSLDNILDRFKSTFQDKSDVILGGLSRIMNYDFPENAYSVYPSLLPGSTYGRKGFAFLSVVNELNEREPSPYVDIVIHELSHVVWNRKMGEIYERAGLRYDSKKHDKSQGFKPLRGNKKYLVNEVAHEDLKEIFAPIIIRCEEFDEIRESERLKYANPQQQLLNVEYGGETYGIVDFFDRIFKTEGIKGKLFDNIMETSARVIYSIQNELAKKKATFDSVGYCKGYEDKLRQQGYMTPIKVNDFPEVNLHQIFSPAS